jgi:hypothetical protein
MDAVTLKTLPNGEGKTLVAFCRYNLLLGPFE